MFCDGKAIRQGNWAAFGKIMSVYTKQPHDYAPRILPLDPKVIHQKNFEDYFWWSVGLINKIDKKSMADQYIL